MANRYLREIGSRTAEVAIGRVQHCSAAGILPRFEAIKLVLEANGYLPKPAAG